MAIACCLSLFSCGQSNDQKAAPDVLVKIDKETLTRADLAVEMPVGISADDSVKFAHAYIKAWIDTQLAKQIASKEIDMTQIDKMVEQYRNDLIMYEYQRRMYDANAQEFPEDTLQAYYEAHKNEFILSQPMVKGVYLKVADDAKSLPSLRKLYRSKKETDIDNLDKSELNGAVHYDYFRDKWIDFEQIESRIPYDFSPSADTFLKNHKNLDYSSGGFTYLLDITDVLHTGQQMPYEGARNLIIERLRYADRKAYDAVLRKELFDKAVEKGQLNIYCDLQ